MNKARWKPVSDGLYKLQDDCRLTVKDNGKELVLFNNPGGAIAVTIPDNIRVCCVSDDDSDADSVINAFREESVKRLIQIREFYIQNTEYNEERVNITNLMSEVANALGYGTTEAAYISGDINELYQAARYGDRLIEQLTKRGLMTSIWDD